MLLLRPAVQAPAVGDGALFRPPGPLDRRVGEMRTFGEQQVRHLDACETRIHGRAGAEPGTPPWLHVSGGRRLVDAGTSVGHDSYFVDPEADGPRVRILVWSLATSPQAPKVLAMSGEQPDLRRVPLRSLRHIASRIVAAVLACPGPCAGAGEGPSPPRDAGNRSDRPPCQCGAARIGIVRLGHGRAV